MNRIKYPMRRDFEPQRRYNRQYTLDEAKAKMLDEICKHCAANNGTPPTIRQLTRAMGYKSHSSTFRPLQALYEDGKLEKVEGNDSYCVVGATWTPPEGVSVE